jgi:hypothetical protein
MRGKDRVATRGSRPVDKVTHEPRDASPSRLQQQGGRAQSVACRLPCFSSLSNWTRKPLSR